MQLGGVLGADGAGWGLGADAAVWGFRCRCRDLGA